MKKRQEYDQFGHAGVDPTAAAGGGYGGYGGVGGFDFGDLGDIFEGFFGGGFGSSRRSNPNAPRQGRDIQTAITIDFFEACKGTKKRFRSSAPTLCRLRRQRCSERHFSPDLVLTAAAAARSESSSAHRSAPSPPRGHVRAVRERAGLSAAPVRSAMARVRYGCLNGWRSQSRREFMTARC